MARGLRKPRARSHRLRKPRCSSTDESEGDVSDYDPLHVDKRLKTEEEHDSSQQGKGEEEQEENSYFETGSDYDQAGRDDARSYEAGDNDPPRENPSQLQTEEPKQSSESDSSVCSSDYPDDNDPDACMICGSVDDWEKLVECSGCFEFIHMDCCKPKLTSVPEGDYFCPLGCKDLNEKLLRDSDKVQATKTQIEEETFAVSHDENWKRDRPAHGLLRAAAIQLALLKDKKPWHFASAVKLSAEGTGLSHNLFDAMLGAMQSTLERGGQPLTVSQLEILGKAKPPADIKRVLRSCGDAGVKRVVLSHRFTNGVHAYFILQFRSVYDAVMDLYQSACLRAGGPVYPWDLSHCDTGRMPNIKKQVKAFARDVGFDRKNPENLTIAASLYSDETTSASKNVVFNPLWISILTTDPDTRRMTKTTAHSLLAMLPDKASIQYSFDFGAEPVSDAVAEMQLSAAQKKSAMGKLLKKAIRTILQDWKQFEASGRPFGEGDSPLRLRVLLARYITDMKERRTLLDLRKGAWHCSACYDFPGTDLPEKEKLGLRSKEQDQKLRTQASIGARTAKEKETEFNARGTKRGLFFKDSCPFTDTKDSSIFLKNGPYSAFSFDALHMKDGVIKYYARFLGGFLGDSFISETMRFGNSTLLTKKFSMHIMEKGIESFHFFPIAIWFGDFYRVLEIAEREKLFLGCCDLLEILALLVDPCPAQILERLKTAIQRFEQHVRWLLDQCAGSKHKVTTKLHELFEHVIYQIGENGLPDAFSAKLLETFHEFIKTFFAESTSKRKDGQAWNEMVQGFFYYSAVEEAKLIATDTLLPKRDAPWSPVPLFTIAELKGSPQDMPKPAQLLLENAIAIAARLFHLDGEATGCRLSKSIPRFYFEYAPGAYGNTWNLVIQCSVRETAITPTVAVVVPGTSKGRFSSGGAFNVLAYHDLNLPIDEHGPADEPEAQSKAECNCRFHDPKFHLFCSLSRQSETRFGIPLLFAKGVAYVWALDPPAASAIPKHTALQHLTCKMERLVTVPSKKVRGVCMAITHPESEKKQAGECLVFTGMNVFGFD